MPTFLYSGGIFNIPFTSISGSPLLFLTSLTAFVILVIDDSKFLRSISLVKVLLFWRHSVRTGTIFSVILLGLPLNFDTCKCYFVVKT